MSQQESKPLVDPSKPGNFCWMELMTPNREKARKFFTDLLGWETQDQQMPAGPDCPAFTYTMAGPRGQPYKVAGMMQMDGPMWEGIPPHWMGYITVEDVDAKAKRVEQLGGTIKVPPMDIPNVGRFTVIQDPTGAVISLITLAQK